MAANLKRYRRGYPLPLRYLAISLREAREAQLEVDIIDCFNYIDDIETDDIRRFGGHRGSF